METLEAYKARTQVAPNFGLNLEVSYIDRMIVEATERETFANGKMIVLSPETHMLETRALDTKVIGKFEGRVGSMRRSAKGRTRRMPNGSRKFIPSWDDPQVVAYKA